jgi:hypothetical protein
MLVQAQLHGDVRVSYHRLEPGTFVAFTPQSKDFQRYGSRESLQ